MDVPAPLASYARAATLPRTGARLFYYDTADSEKPALLLIHGLGDEADTWRRIVAPLSRDYRVIAPDLPGFGRSPLPPSLSVEPPALASLLVELLDALGVRTAVVVGSSLGALLAQLVALAEPARVERLVLVDGAIAARAKLPAAMLLMLLPALGERRYRRLARDLESAYRSLYPYYGALDSLPADEQRFLRRRVAERVTSPTQRRAYFRVLRSLASWMRAHGRDAALRSARLEVPTLYVWGSADHIIEPATGRAAWEHHRSVRRADANGAPPLDFVLVDGAGHLPHQESPERFVALLNRTPA